MAYTVAQIINIAKISQYISKIDVTKGSLFGKRIAPNTPQILYAERMAVEWMYNLDPTNDTLTLTSNYLYSLCRGYNLKAQNINGSGGSISPISPVAAPDPLQFIVAASGTPMVDGETSITIDSFIGYNLLFSRGGIPQSTITSESSWYSWNKSTGLFSISPAAATGELFQIYAI